VRAKRRVRGRWFVVEPVHVLAWISGGILLPELSFRDSFLH
jgi:hypothetical protein